jgi:hypothetical protein
MAVCETTAQPDCPDYVSPVTRTALDQRAIAEILVAATYAALFVGFVVWLLTAIYTSLFGAPALVSEIPLGITIGGLGGVIISMLLPPPRSNDESR